MAACQTKFGVSLWNETESRRIISTQIRTAGFSPRVLPDLRVSDWIRRGRTPTHLNGSGVAPLTPRPRPPARFAPQAVCCMFGKLWSVWTLSEFYARFRSSADLSFAKQQVVSQRSNHLFMWLDAEQSQIQAAALFGIPVEF